MNPLTGPRSVPDRSTPGASRSADRLVAAVADALRPGTGRGPAFMVSMRAQWSIATPHEPDVLGGVRRLADWKSAIQQAGSLRYPVAQISNLLCRTLPACRAQAGTARFMVPYSSRSSRSDKPPFIPASVLPLQ